MGDSGEEEDGPEVVAGEHFWPVEVELLTYTCMDHNPRHLRSHATREKMGEEEGHLEVCLQIPGSAAVEVVAGEHAVSMAETVEHHEELLETSKAARFQSCSHRCLALLCVTSEHLCVLRQEQCRCHSRLHSQSHLRFGRPFWKGCPWCPAGTEERMLVVVAAAAEDEMLPWETTALVARVFQASPVMFRPRRGKSSSSTY